jgi:hypothetical protein
MVNHPKPTGDPACPPFIKRAKHLRRDIDVKAGTVTGDDDEDDGLSDMLQLQQGNTPPHFVPEPESDGSDSESDNEQAQIPSASRPAALPSKRMKPVVKDPPAAASPPVIVARVGAIPDAVPGNMPTISKTAQRRRNLDSAIATALSSSPRPSAAGGGSAELTKMMMHMSQEARNDRMEREEKMERARLEQRMLAEEQRREHEERLERARNEQRMEALEQRRQDQRNSQQMMLMMVMMMGK